MYVTCHTMSYDVIPRSDSATARQQRQQRQARQQRQQRQCTSPDKPLSISEASISLPHTQMPSLYPRNPQPSQVQVNCMTLPARATLAWLVGRTGLTPPFVQIVSNPPNSCHTLRYTPKGYVVQRGASSASVGAHMPMTPLQPPSVTHSCSDFRDGK